MQVAFDVESNKMKKNEVATVVGKREGGEAKVESQARSVRLKDTISLSF